MWEGYDGWAHFSYIQHIAEHGRLPVRGDTVSKEIRSSLSLMPSPYGLNGFNLPLITHDDYWRLPPEERLARKRALASLPAGFRTQTDDALSLYEAQQPPLGVRQIRRWGNRMGCQPTQRCSQNSSQRPLS